MPKTKNLNDVWYRLLFVDTRRSSSKTHCCQLKRRKTAERFRNGKNNRIDYVFVFHSIRFNARQWNDEWTATSSLYNAPLILIHISYHINWRKLPWYCTGFSIFLLLCNKVVCSISLFALKSTEIPVWSWNCAIYLNKQKSFDLLFGPRITSNDVIDTKAQYETKTKELILFASPLIQLCVRTTWFIQYFNRQCASDVTFY